MFRNPKDKVDPKVDRKDQDKVATIAYNMFPWE